MVLPKYNFFNSRVASVSRNSDGSLLLNSMYYLMLANLSTAYFHIKICRMCVEIKFEEKNPKIIQPNSILLSELYSLLFFQFKERAIKRQKKKHTTTYQKQRIGRDQLIGCMLGIFFGKQYIFTPLYYLMYCLVH